MKKIIYRFALFMTILSFVICLVSGKSLMTTMVRSTEVFFGTIIVIIIALNVLRWGLRPAANLEEQGKE
jgi:hypothetical protein